MSSSGQPLGKLQPKQGVPGEERRRSQRVVIRVAVQLQITLQGQTSDVKAETVVVNDHGAMVLASRGFPLGTRLELTDQRTQKSSPCRVVRPPRETSEGFQLAVEFEKPLPGFWHIYFPPSASSGAPTL